MDVTLEQARVLDAVARLGTVQKAAEELNRGHASMIYSLKRLEEQTELRIFEKVGRRNRLTHEGEVALKFCRKLLDTQREFSNSCKQIKSGWEPALKIVYDEVVDFNIIGQALYQLHRMKTPTEVKILSAHLGGVEALFAREAADFMVTILPLQKLQVKSKKLKPIDMLLVAHRDHPLCQAGRARASIEDLNKHTFVTISTTPGQLGLGTEQMKFDSYFFVNSFMNKKMALMNKLGFGWLPDYLIQTELKKGTLQKVRTEIDNSHILSASLYFRAEESLGAAARAFLEKLID
jgi:DNA-binding transcriptional LysR family regulator